MKSLLCREPRRLELVERDEPKRSAGEVLVAIRRVGVCGTDYHIYLGDQPYLNYPRVIGHELAGEVIEAPQGSSLRPGTIVSIIPYLHCGACVACRAGKTNCCQTLQTLGVHRDGGMCERIAVPEENVVAADGLSLEAAAMVEFLAIGAHGVRRSGAQPGQRALIVGAGPIGIAAAIFAKAAGAEVAIADVNERRLTFCTDVLGVTSPFRADADLPQRLAVATDGSFYEVVIDATGNPRAMEKGFSYVAHGGAYVFLSIVRGAIALEDPEFHKRETTLFASRNATRADFDTVLAAIRRGDAPTAAMATHHGRIDDAAELIPQWSDPSAGVIKGLIEV